jgi:hypothetical protein
MASRRIAARLATHSVVQMIEAWEAKQVETKKLSATAEQGAWQD